MVADIYGVMSQASLQRLGPSLSAQASQRNPPASPSGNDGASSPVSLSERAKRMSSAEGKAEMQALAAQIKDARATADTGSAEGKARLRADIQTMVDGYGSQQKPATAVDPASQSQGMQQAAVASYLAMSLMR